MRFFRNIWADISKGENIELYLTIIAAISLSALNLFGLGQPLAPSITLAVLALIAYSNLVNRRKLDSTLEHINSSPNGTLLERYPESFNQDLKMSRELWIYGISLARTMLDYYPMFKEKLSGNFKLRILVVNPNGAVNKMHTKRSFRPMKTEEGRRLILSRLEDACHLAKEFPNKVEIKVTDYMPPFGVFVTNPQQPDGKIFAELYLYKSRKDIPRLVIEQHDANWYTIFEDHILKVWEDAVEWKCKEDDPGIKPG